MYPIKQLYKLYCLLFYKLVKTVLRLDKIFDTGLLPNFSISMEWVMYRAFFLVFFLQLNWYFILSTALEIIIRKRIPNIIEDKLISALLFIGIVSTFNYFTLIYKKRWYEYDEEFANYSRTTNRVINIIIALLYIISVILFLLVSRISSNLYHAGLIDF